MEELQMKKSLTSKQQLDMLTAVQGAGNGKAGNPACHCRTAGTHQNIDDGQAAGRTGTGRICCSVCVCDI